MFAPVWCEELITGVTVFWHRDRSSVFLGAHSLTRKSLSADPSLPDGAEGPGQRPFWQRKSLDALTEAEWESLCDGCGQCCLLKLEDEDTGELALTNIVCQLYDRKTGRCGDYANRQTRVPGCLQLTPQSVPTLTWLPETCGYVRVSKGQDLADWHPLKTGDPHSARRSRTFVGNSALKEEDVPEEDRPDYIIALIEPGR